MVPNAWLELSSWSLGKPHILSFGFRLQDSKCSVPPCDKTRSQTGRDKQSYGSQGTGGGKCNGATWPILTSGPLLLSWAIVTQRLEATSEPGRTLHEDLVWWQFRLNREVGMLGCPRISPSLTPTLSPRLEARDHPVTLPVCPQNGLPVLTATRLQGTH